MSGGAVNLGGRIVALSLEPGMVVLLPPLKRFVIQVASHSADHGYIHVRAIEVGSSGEVRDALVPQSTFYYVDNYLIEEIDEPWT